MIDENKLIRQIRQHNSRESADELIRFYYKEIYVYVYRQTGRKEDAMDLTQNIFISVLKSIDSFDSRKSSFRTWLYRVASNKIIDSRRKRTISALPIDDVEPCVVGDFTENVRDRLLLNEIEEYVSGFSNDVQTVFRLHIYGEKTFREIADVTGEPESTVKAKYYRLIRLVRKEFKIND